MYFGRQTFAKELVLRKNIAGLNMVNKVIHFCWFGRGEKSNIIKKCMESWHKICPDYEIKEWNEDNFDINICTYVKQAYEAKKYAFVSDYARFYI